MLYKKSNGKKRLANSSKIMVHIVLCFLFVSIFSITASAHSPSNMDLSYAVETQTLKVTITHQVANPDTHYVYNIVIKKNGETYNTYDYTSQSSITSFTYNYNINTTEGDVIEVTASCIQTGSITRQVTVSADNGTSGDSNGTSTPGFELTMSVVAIAAVLLWKWKK